MGIHNNTWSAEGIAEHDICRFSADTGQGDQFFHRLRYLSGKALGHGLSADDEVFRLVLEETRGANDLFKFKAMRRCQFCRPPISLKERRGNLIDSLVGALGREDRGHEQFPRGTMVQLHLWAWHRALKCFRNLSDARSLVRR